MLLSTHALQRSGIWHGDGPIRLADRHMCRGVLACIYTKNQIINSKLQDLQNRGSVSHHSLVTQIQKAVCSLEGQIVQVMPALVQHSSKPGWDPQTHNQNAWNSQQQSCPEMIVREAHLCCVLGPIVHCVLHTIPCSMGACFWDMYCWKAQKGVVHVKQPRSGRDQRKARGLVQC